MGWEMTGQFKRDVDETLARVDADTQREAAANWKNQNVRFHEEHDDGLGLFRAMLIAVPVGAVSLYFVGWWVITFFRALWRAR